MERSRFVRTPQIGRMESGMSNRAERRAAMKGQRGRAENATQSARSWVGGILMRHPERDSLSAAMLRYLEESGPHLAGERSCFQACELIREYLKHADQKSTVVPVTLQVVELATGRQCAQVGNDPAHIRSGRSWNGHVVLAVHGLGVVDPTAGQVSLMDPRLPQRPMFMPDADQQLLRGGAIGLGVVAAGEEGSDAPQMFQYTYSPCEVESSYRDIPWVRSQMDENAELVAGDAAGFGRQLRLVQEYARTLPWRQSGGAGNVR